MHFQENDVRLNTDSIKRHSTLYRFGNFTIRQHDDSTNGIRRHDVSAKRRFDEMTFRQNYVAPIAVVCRFYFSEFLFNGLNT